MTRREYLKGLLGLAAAAGTSLGVRSARHSSQASHDSRTFIPPFAAVCRTLPDRASTQRKSNDLPLSLCAAFCCRLPPLVAPKGQEKGKPRIAMNRAGSMPAARALKLRPLRAHLRTREW
jgi:hypothetical protein